MADMMLKFSWLKFIGTLYFTMLLVTCMSKYATQKDQIPLPCIDVSCIGRWCVLRTHMYTLHIYLPYSMTQQTRRLASTNSLYLNCHTEYTNQPTIISRHNSSLIRCILSHATICIFVTGRDLAAAPPCIPYAIIFFYMPLLYTLSHTFFCTSRTLLHLRQAFTPHTFFLLPANTLFVTYVGLQGMEKIMEPVGRDTHFFINTELGRHLPVIQLLSFLP